MVVVGPFGSAVMRYQMEFEKEMNKQNYENPFTRQQALVNNIFQRREDGSFIIDRSKETNFIYICTCNSAPSIYKNAVYWLLDIFL